MPETRVELAEIVLPEFGLPREEPTIPAATYEARIAAVRQRASDAGYDVLMVYADREHFANLAYLTGFDPRFEEALLILTQDQTPTPDHWLEVPAYLVDTLRGMDCERSMTSINWPPLNLQLHMARKVCAMCSSTYIPA